MKTAFEMARKWDLIPKFTPNPEDRTTARDLFRKALQEMSEKYVEKTEEMLHPPQPGPRPKQYKGAPPFPEGLQKPAEPQRPRSPIGLPMYPSDDQLYTRSLTEAGKKEVENWKAEMETFEAAVKVWRPQYDVVMNEERRLHEEYTKINDEWLDTVFFPGEAERVIWETANEVYEESLRRMRAEADLARDELDIQKLKNEKVRENLARWYPALWIAGAAGGVGLLVLAMWRLFT